MSFVWFLYPESSKKPWWKIKKLKKKIYIYFGNIYGIIKNNDII